MRRIGANYIITNAGKALKNAYIELEDDGTIINVVETDGNLRERSGLEFYNGVLVPGFVNCHAHLELSYMKGQIEQKKGLPHFISSLQSIRKKGIAADIDKGMQVADAKMYHEGIVFVGDISNGTDSLVIKSKSKIEYHTFVEVFGVDKYRAQEAFDSAQAVLNAYSEAGLSANITPHAPYSVSSKLFELITNQAYCDTVGLSIHNQETPSENQLFIDKTGDLHDSFIKAGVNFDNWTPTGYNSLPSVLVQMPKCSKLNLVHNTFTKQEDIDKAKAYNPQTYWTLCPNANLYIENRLPDIDLFIENNLNICIGTDSLASNHQLSILEELKMIQKHYPKVPFETVIRWATKNGADFFGLQSRLGSFEKGKKPAVVLIENFDFNNFGLKPESTSRRLI
jgi:cytosine/adenosine deaminase-related metal-dependent hydrolase